MGFWGSIRQACRWVWDHPVRATVWLVVWIAGAKLLNSVADQIIFDPITEQLLKVASGWVGRAWAMTLGPALSYLQAGAVVAGVMFFTWWATRKGDQFSLRRFRTRRRFALTFEPKDPWVKYIPNARTQPRSNPDPLLPHDQWVETKSKWYRVLPQNSKPGTVVRGVRLFLSNVETMRDAVFAGSGFGSQRPVRFANDDVSPFEPRDIHYGENHYVDVLSIDAEHEKIFVKWPAMPRWLEYEHIFDAAGVYRLTIIATASDGTGDKLLLVLLWLGRWDTAEMWVDEGGKAEAKAKAALWGLFHEGTNMRVAGIERGETPEWMEQFIRWHNAVIGIAGVLSGDLMNHLKSIFEMPRRQGGLCAKVTGEMLARLQPFLTKDIPK